MFSLVHKFLYKKKNMCFIINVRQTVQMISSGRIVPNTFFSGAPSTSRVAQVATGVYRRAESDTFFFFLGFKRRSTCTKRGGGGIYRKMCQGGGGGHGPAVPPPPKLLFHHNIATLYSILNCLTAWY